MSCSFSLFTIAAPWNIAESIHLAMVTWSSLEGATTSLDLVPEGWRGNCCRCGETAWCGRENIASSVLGVEAACDWHEAWDPFPRHAGGGGGGVLTPRRQSLDKQCSRKHRPKPWMEKKMEFKTPVEFNPIRVQILKRLQNPWIYMIVMQRKRKQGKCQSPDLGQRKAGSSAKMDLI